MKETIVELKPVEHRETWILWEIEDRLAERISHVFCSPSMAMAEKQFHDAKAKQGAKDGELVFRVVAMYVNGEVKVPG